MVFGSCVFWIEGKRKQIKPKAVSINGKQTGFVVDFCVAQTFQHSETGAREIRYIVPTNLKLCMYDTTFVIGDEVIKPKIEEKAQAKEIYAEATQEHRAAIISENLGNGLCEFKLGNIVAGVEVRVEVRCSLIASLKTKDSTFFKFPLDTCTTSGSTDCVMNHLDGDFAFSLNCEGDNIRGVQSNVGGHFDAETHTFTVSKREAKSTSAIIVTTTHDQPIASQSLLSGNVRCVTVIPDEMPGTGVENNEFVFVCDCSGSMSGSRIKQVRECLSIFIKSLPQGCFFNIVRFGSSFECLFPVSAEYNKANAQKAIVLAANMQANLGGTELHRPLEKIFSWILKATGVRQLFVMTDGEVGDTDALINLVSRNNDHNRIFALGIGSGADAGLVEGLADNSGGSAAFVGDGSDVSSKVIPQLLMAKVQSICDLSLHIEGHDDLQIYPFPIRPITPGIASTLFCSSTKGFASDESILLHGQYGSEDVDIVVENEQKLSSDNRSISALHAFQALDHLTRLCDKLNGEERERVKSQCVAISEASGVLCSYTAFVGFSNETYHAELESVDVKCSRVKGGGLFALGPSRGQSTRGGSLFDTGPFDAGLFDAGRPRAVHADVELHSAHFLCADLFGDDCCDIGDPFCAAAPKAAPSKAHAKKRSRAKEPRPMFAVEKKAKNVRAAPKAEPKIAESPKREKTVERSAVIGLQAIDGSWTDYERLKGICGKEVPVFAELQSLSGAIQRKVFATILGVAILRKFCSEQHDSWILIESKACEWLSRHYAEFEQLISRAVSALA